MGKKAKFGAITPPKRDKPRKRPGRHSKKPNKKRNPVARQLRHFKKKMIKNKKAYDRKKLSKI